MRFPSPSPDATRAAARHLGEVLEDGVLGLVGPLGAGKTLFVKGLAEGLGVDPRLVASPTFVIVHEYGERLAHVDLYRVESVPELEAAGFLDLLEPGRVVAVEWADRLPEALPRDRLEVRIERGAALHRTLDAIGLGPASRRALARWREALEATWV